MAAIITHHAVRDTRTPQGAVAWSISLITFPLLALPLYWVFGRSKFHGYIDAMRAGEARFQELVGNKHHIPAVETLSERQRPNAPRTSFETLAEMPFLGGNDLELLVNGKASFDSIFEYIEQAENYILIQFFIVHDDGLGNRLKELLIRKAKQGLRINFLYDEVGSHSTPTIYWDDLREAGVEAHPFHTRRGRGNRFQLNFRNHRKGVAEPIPYAVGHSPGSPDMANPPGQGGAVVTGYYHRCTPGAEGFQHFPQE